MYILFSGSKIFIELKNHVIGRILTLYLYLWSRIKKKNRSNGTQRVVPLKKNLKSRHQLANSNGKIFGTMKDFRLQTTSLRKLTGAHYAEILTGLPDAIKEKAWEKLAKGLCIHDNSPVSNARAAVSAMTSCGFKEVDNPPYSSNQSPSHVSCFWAL